MAPAVRSQQYIEPEPNKRDDADNCHACPTPCPAWQDSRIVSSSRSMSDATTFEIRDAVEADAAAACEVMRRSISELCLADHHGDCKILSAWLANKKPEIFRAWLARGNRSYLLAIGHSRVLGVNPFPTQDGIRCCVRSDSSAGYFRAPACHFSRTNSPHATALSVGVT